MPLDAQKLLEDMRLALEAVRSFAADRREQDFRSDPMLRAAVERQFIVVGEALNQLARLDPSLATRIPDHRKIIAFRNVLVHGYDIVDATVVWTIVSERATPLLAEVESLLADLGGTP